MRRLLVACLSCLLLGPPAIAQAHQLIDLYRLAQTQDQTLAKALHTRDAAVETRPQALSTLLPQLNASANLQRQKIQYLSTSSSFLRAGQNTFATNKSWTVSLSQTIWSFQSYWQLREADVQVAAAENTYLQAQQDLVFRVAQAYFNVLAAKDTVRADLAARDAFKGQFDEAQQRFKVGLSTITDVQQAQSSYDTSRATLIGDRRALANQRQALAVIVGRYTPQLDPLQETIPLTAPTPASPDHWVGAAKQDNFDLRNADLQWLTAQRDIHVQRSQFYPSLALQGSIGQNDSGGQLGTNQRDYAIGLSLNVPIFQGGRVFSQVRQAQATAEQDRSQYQLTLRTTEQQVRNAYEGVTSGIASIRAFKQAVKSSQTALKSTQIGFRVGIQTEIDVLTAQQNLYNALKNYYQSRYDYINSVLTLKQLAGHLTQADLVEVDNLLSSGGDEAPPQFPGLPERDMTTGAPAVAASPTAVTAPSEASTTSGSHP